MDNNVHSKELIEGIAEQFSEILDNSEQAIYIYLEDSLKVCNKNFSDLLGYSSPEEWAAIHSNFPEAFVAPESQHDLVSTYQNAMNAKVGAQKNITWKKKDGKTVDTSVILVPVAFRGHLFALHYISPAA